MNKQELLEELTELELTRDELSEKLTKVCDQILKIKQKIRGNLCGLCFVHGVTYYRIIEDRRDTIDYIYCSPEEKYATICTYQEKLNFISPDKKEITREEFDKALVKTFNNFEKL